MFRFDAVRFTFRLSGRLSPRLAGRMAAHLFHTPPRVATLTPDELALARKADEILSGHPKRMVKAADQEVATWRLPAEGESRGTVVLVHGWTSAARYMVGFALEVTREGFDAVLMDLPAHGSSPAKQTDVAECGRALRDILKDTGPVAGLIGHSFAGGVIAVALSEPEMAPYVKDARIALVAAPDQYSYVTRQFAGFIGLSDAARDVFEATACARIGMPLPDAQGHKLMADVPCPMLIVHCRDDAEIAYSQALRWKAGRPSARLHLTEGFGHRSIVHAPEITRMVADYVANGAAEDAATWPWSLRAIWARLVDRFRRRGSHAANA